MLPPSATRTITIYPRWQNQDTGLFKPMRRILRFCSWEERSIAAAFQTGIALREPVSIRVFDKTSGLKYVEPHIWDALLNNEIDGFWTCDPIQRPLILPFENNAEMEYGTESQVTTWEHEIKRENPGAVNVTERNDNRKTHGGHIRMRAGG